MPLSAILSMNTCNQLGKINSNSRGISDREQPKKVIYLILSSECGVYIFSPCPCLEHCPGELAHCGGHDCGKRDPMEHEFREQGNTNDSREQGARENSREQ